VGKLLSHVFRNPGKGGALVGGEGNLPENNHQELRRSLAVADLEVRYGRGWGQKKRPKGNLYRDCWCSAGGGKDMRNKMGLGIEKKIN